MISYQPCLAGQACNASLTCVTWDQNACGGLYECCREVGGLDQPCRPTAPRCNDGYTCDSHAGMCQNAMFECYR